MITPEELAELDEAAKALDARPEDDGKKRDILLGGVEPIVLQDQSKEALITFIKVMCTQMEEQGNALQAARNKLERLQSNPLYRVELKFFDRMGQQIGEEESLYLHDYEYSDY